MRTLKSKSITNVLNFKTKVFTKISVFLLALLCHSVISFAGVINIDVSSLTPDGMTPAGYLLPSGTLGQPYSYTFTLTGTSDVTSPVIWVINNTDLANLTGAGLCFNAAASVHSITTDPTHAGSSCSITPTNKLTQAETIRFRVGVANGDGGSQQIYFTLNIVRPPMDIALVLDKSGSMSYSYTGNSDNSNERWNALKAGVGILISKMQSSPSANPNDKIGVYFFDASPSLATGLTAVSSVLTSSLFSPPNDVPGTSTALGDGILAGRTLLSGTSGNSEHIVVFSDGVQNSGDQVDNSGAPPYTQTFAGHPLGGTIGGSPIKIHTVCLGTTGSLPALMDGIATNNAYYNSSSSSEFNNINSISTDFQTFVNDIEAGDCPQFVDIRDSQFVKTNNYRYSTTQSFKVNKQVKGVFAALTNDFNLNTSFDSVFKDGVNLTQYVHQSSGAGYHTFYINFPIKGLDGVTPDGIWKITSSGYPSYQYGAIARTVTTMPSTFYQLSFTVDDNFTKINYSLGASDFKVSESLKPSVTLTNLGKPITTANITAILLKPGDDINDILATSNVNYSNTPGDSSSPDVLKFAQLMKNPNFVKSIKTNSQVFNLSYNSGTKTYGGTYSSLDVAGVYRLIYKLSYTDSANGQIVRYYQKSFNVRFKDVDLGKSNVIASLDSLSGNSIITFRPVSSTGKFIGPGFSSVISLNSPTLKISKIDDIGDGTYKIHLNGKLQGNGMITVLNDTIYNGNLSNLPVGSSPSEPSWWKKIWLWILALIAIIIGWFAKKKKKTP